MELFYTYFQAILHIDLYLTGLTATYGLWIYAILFLVIFCETGLVITPFLPGDSLLFAAGMLASLGKLNPHYLAFILTLAAILGDSFNYFIGSHIGIKPFQKNYAYLLNKKHLERTQAFFQKHGNKTIIIARFMPIIRTFVPFVAGIASMNYKKFLLFNVLGAFLWVYSILYLAYWFGRVPFVADNFTFVIFAIVLLSLLPLFIQSMRYIYSFNQPNTKD